jgi:hypothetical protein
MHAARRRPSFLATLHRLVVRTTLTAITLVLGTSVVATPSQPTPDVHEKATTVSASATAPGFDTIVATGLGAEMVGFTWDGTQPATFKLRARTGTHWSAWSQVDGSLDDGPDRDSPEFRSIATAGPVWVGHNVDAIEVHVVHGTPAHLRLHAIDSEPVSPSNPPFGVSRAGASTPVPGLITRAQWGADESYRTLNCDGKPEYATDVKRAIVHHTDNSNDYQPSDSAALVRGIYYFHTHTQGWCDIAYNFLIDRYGQIFEGRYGGIGRPVIGGHASGFNTGSTGVAVIGDFETGAVPPAAYQGLRALLSWKLAYHGVDPNGLSVAVTGANTSARWPEGTAVVLANIGGHRDTNYTDCPGQYLYAMLGQLRADVAADISRHRDQRLVCDWNGDGTDTPAWFENGYWYIRDENTTGFADTVVYYGVGTWKAVCGDWNGDGVDTIGVYTGGRWLLRNSNTPGPPDLVVDFGGPGDTPVVGNWDGLLGDSLGLYTNGTWRIRNVTVPGAPDKVFDFGAAGYTPVVGDWNGDHRDGIGIFVNGLWRLRNSATPGVAEISADGYGLATDIAVVGDWDGDGAASVGVSRGAYWFLRDDPVKGYANHVFPY